MRKMVKTKISPDYINENDNPVYPGEEGYGK